MIHKIYSLENLKIHYSFCHFDKMETKYMFMKEMFSNQHHKCSIGMLSFIFWALIQCSDKLVKNRFLKYCSY